MALTSTMFNACDAIISLDNSAGSLVDISGSSNNVEFDFNNEIGEFKSFGSKWKARIQCGKDASISLRIVGSKDTAEAMKNALDWFFTTNGLKTLRVDYPDSSSGSERLQCEVVLESMNMPLPADDANPVMIDIALLPSGAVDRTIL